MYRFILKRNIYKAKMILTNQHKALLITVLLSGTVVLSVFNLSIKKESKRIAESYYELEPEEILTEEEIKILEALEQLNASKAETNQAHNETQDKRFAEAYKPIAPPKDYENERLNNQQDPSENLASRTPNIDEDSGLKQEELSSFSKVNDLLKKQEEATNAKSTMSYSLVGRKLLNNPTPIYLCEIGGKIVVNITVNGRGEVTDTYINSSSTSSNECLTDHALEYAQQAIFDSASKASQIGSITFLFIGKR